MNAFPKRALVSVSDKTGLAPFAAGLAELGFEIVSTGGTRRFLEENGIAGHRRVVVYRLSGDHGGPRKDAASQGARRHSRTPRSPRDAAAIRDHGIVPFQVVVCNLYPFEKTVARPDVSLDEAIEQIDVGGPSMVRAAAKNHAYVAVVTDPDQYPAVLENLRAGRLSPEFRRQLAQAAFERTADLRSGHRRLSQRADGRRRRRPAIPCPAFDAGRPRRLDFGMARIRTKTPPCTSSPTRIRRALRGPKSCTARSSPTTICSTSTRPWSWPASSTEPAAVVIKHNNPCGCALGQTLAEAFAKAYAGDPVSAFGSIVGFNRPLDAATAELMTPARPVHRSGHRPGVTSRRRLKSSRRGPNGPRTCGC